MRKLIIIIAVTIFIVIPIYGAYAQGIVPSNCLSEGKNCQFSDFIALAINVSNLILKFTGAFALLFFVYGGFVWITAMGNSSRIEQGRNILTNTVIAIIIILGAFTAVQFIGDILGVDKSNFNKFTDSKECVNQGDACTPANKTQNVYACSSSGTCTTQTLCDYWKNRKPNPYGIDNSYSCQDTSTINASSKAKCVSNLCDGAANIRCCPQ